MADDYIEFLKSIKPRTVYVCPYPGNAGDGLIVLGTHHLLDELGITRTLVPAKADLILYPGGSPVLWQQDLDVWRDVWQRFPDKDFVVGPSTFQYSTLNWADLLRNKGRTVRALFAREPVSYEILQKTSWGVAMQIGLADDPAFSLRRSEFIKELRKACTEEYSLFAFRRDHEGSADSRLFTALRSLLPSGPGYLLERIYRRRRYQEKIAVAQSQEPDTHPRMVSDVASLNFDMFVQGVQRAKVVHTDRLHVMILACLLGKKVFAYGTAYRKLETVYQYSMKDWADVSFQGRGIS